MKVSESPIGRLAGTVLIMGSVLVGAGIAVIGTMEYMNAVLAATVSISWTAFLLNISLMGNIPRYAHEAVWGSKAVDDFGGPQV